MSKQSYNISAFLEKCTKEHDDAYDYSLVSLENVNSDIDVVCKKHGVFKIRANLHLQGYGCRKCKSESVFLKKANKLYKNKFDYSKVKFTRMCDKVEIICPVHGSFWRAPDYHLKGTGCKKCNS